MSLARDGKTLHRTTHTTTMRIRGVVAEHPMPVAFSLAFLAALVATVASALTADGVVLTLRLSALTVVLLLFAAGFWAGPVGERYL